LEEFKISKIQFVNYNCVLIRILGNLDNKLIIKVLNQYTTNQYTNQYTKSIYTIKG